MKTLKQQLDQIQEETEEIYWNEDSIIYAVKEWLTQKQDGWVKGSEVWNEYKELLEELNQ